MTRARAERWPFDARVAPRIAFYRGTDSVSGVKARYTVVLDREADGRAIASIPGVPGCHAYGRTPSEAVRRVRTTLRFYLKELLREGQRLPKQLRPITVDIHLAV